MKDKLLNSKPALLAKKTKHYAFLGKRKASRHIEQYQERRKRKYLESPEYIKYTHLRHESDNLICQQKWEAARAVANKAAHSRCARASDYEKLVRIETTLGNLSKAKEITAFIEKKYSKRQKLRQDDLLDLLAVSTSKAEVLFAEKLQDIKEYRQQLAAYKKSKRKNKIAVVSAISGGYDQLRPLMHIDERFDYIVYSDSPIWAPYPYQVRPMPYIDVEKIRSARYVKTNLHKLLGGEYDTVVWVDANIVIAGDIYPYIEKTLNTSSAIGAFRHPVRDSTYQEIDICIEAHKDDIGLIQKQKEDYQNLGFKNNNLIESNFLVCDLTDKRTSKFLEQWWSELLRYSRRDQLSINFALEKSGISFLQLEKKPFCTRNLNNLLLLDHGNDYNDADALLEAIKTPFTDQYEGQAIYNEQKKKRLAKVKDKSIAVVVCVHNAPDDTKLCLESIKKYKTPNLGLIVIDDGSDEAARVVVDNFVKSNKSWVQTTRHNEAWGYTRSANQGLKLSSADLTILLNSDTVVTKDWALKMADAAFSNKGVGIVGPLSSAASTQSIPNHESSENQTAINDLPDNMTPEDMNAYCEKMSYGNYLPRVPLVHGFCYGITRETIKRIGYLDEKTFPRGYGEENDYCLRAADAGLDLVIATHTYVLHTKSKSFVGKEREQLMQDGDRLLRERHGNKRRDRSVATMRHQPLLVQLRRLADELYARQYVRSNLVSDDSRIIHYAVDDSAINQLWSFKRLTAALTDISNTITWSRLATKRTKGLTSIVIVVYNNIDITIDCLDSLYKSKTKDNFEVIVVNNGSGIDTTIALREKIKNDLQDKAITLIESDYNLNFSVGNNVGFSYTKGEKVVFLNNDTTATDGWLDTINKALDKTDVAAVQPMLLYPDETVQSLGTVITKESRIAHALYAHTTEESLRKTRKLNVLTAACILVRAADYAKLEGFSPEFINGQEDVDFCLRLVALHKNKAYLECNAEAIVYHYEGKTYGRGRYIINNRLKLLEREPHLGNIDDSAVYESDNASIESWELMDKIYLPRAIKLCLPKLATSRK